EDEDWQVEQQAVDTAIGHYQGLAYAPPEDGDVQDGEKKNAQQADRQRRRQMDLLPAQEMDDRVDGVLQAFESDEGAAKGQGDEARQKSAHARRESQRAQSLQNLQVDFAVAVNAVE